jgi:tetratricopeptide (TPR) repeat protein
VVASNFPPTAGSIADISGRLALWARRDSPGLMRVEYSSEFARQRVMTDLQNHLSQQQIACREIVLPSYQEPEAIVQFLLEQFDQMPSGVVSITGFATAFSTRLPLREALRIVNFNRERFAAFPLRQVWWMTPVFLQTAIHAMPDLDSWFTARLQLTEVILAPADSQLLPFTAGSTTHIDDAHHRAQRLIQQFESAHAIGANDLDLLQTYLLPALEALAEVNAQKELHDLTTQFEGLLGRLKQIDSPDMATSLGRLANLYYSQGRYGEAEPLYRRALAISEKQLGKNHPDVATSLSNLALLHKSQGRYGEAESLFQRALAIQEQQLGENHFDIATSLNNLANLYQSQGRYGEAESFYQRSLQIRKQQLGVDHPDTAAVLNNLAWLYKSQGRYEEAEPLFIRALNVREQQLGSDHPNTATSMNELANLYKTIGRNTEAEQLLSKVITIYEQKLGENHPWTTTSLNNLAGLYKAQGRYTEAESLFIQSLLVREQKLGADHPATATSLNNLAGLYKAQGRYGEAEPLFLRALEISTNVLGTGHPKTQTVQQDFRDFLSQVIQTGQTAQLSDHPLTQDLLRQMQMENDNA